MTQDAMMFVDQENLRNGANEYDSDYEYDFVKLRDVLLEDYRTIRSYWFASWHPDTDGSKPQGYYMALEMSEYRVYESPRVPRESTCDECGTENETYVEKGIDIQIATELIAQAYEDGYDTAILVSGDSDYRRAIEHVQDLGKRVVAAGWGSSSSEKIKRQSDKFIRLEDIADTIEL
jgi:uncharacterized LabA/DUF88 family protein